MKFPHTDQFFVFFHFFFLFQGITMKIPYFWTKITKSHRLKELLALDG